VVIPNAYRVLKRSGHISPDFRWTDPERAEDPRDVLRTEGIRFDEWSRADPEQRMSAEELAALLSQDREVDRAQ
jgi:hypothetical protein